jgi:hypothetical protein
MKISHILAIASIGLLVGCAGGGLKKLPMKVVDNETGELRDAYLSVETAGDTLDRSSSYTQLGMDTGKVDENGDPIIKQTAGELTTGPTVPGQMAVGFTNGMGAALIQRDAAIRSAKIKTEGATDTSINVQGGTAFSQSDAGARAETDVDITETTTSCGGGCL